METTVGKMAEHSLGKMLDKKKNRGNLRPYLRNLNVRWFEFNLEDILEMRFEAHEYEKYTACKGDLLICEGGYPGRAAIWSNDEPVFFQKAIHRVRHSNPIYNKWLLYFLYSCDVTGVLKNYFTGTGIQHFTGQALHRFMLPIAPLDDMEKHVERFEELLIETQRLEAIYQRKLNALAELKQSILQKAFSGKLTQSMPEVIHTGSSLIEVNTKSPIFTANIISYAYYRHVLKKRDKTFGHVKTQKILHSVESIGGIELGRTPMKDAAGPNDFKHQLKAEKWAKSEQFFEFVKRQSGNGYDFRKLARFDKMMVEARAMTAPYRKKLDKVIDILLPMNSREAEIFATVHAAWNNLVLDGADVCNEAIIRAARDNWHPDKLKIPKDNFQNAIRLIRRNGLVPDGTAKWVGGQERLL